MFLESNITTAPFILLTQRTPAHMCPARTIQFRRILNISEQLPSRIPHSSITMNSLPCGKFKPYTNNMTTQKLFADDYIAVVPFKTLYTEESASAVNAEGIYYQLTQASNRSLTRSFYTFIQKHIIGQQNPDFHIFVGLERYSNRVCSSEQEHEEVQQEEIIVTQFTFLVFGMFNQSVDISNLLPFENRLVIPAYSPFSISFAPASTDDAVATEYVCPYYRKPVYIPPPEPLNVRLCFPSSSIVTRLTDNNGTEIKVKISNVHIGDIVLDGNGNPSRVVAFSHRRHSISSPFIRLTFKSILTSTSTTSTLTISHKHYIILRNHQLIYAEDVSIGDIIYGRLIREQLKRIRYLVTNVEHVIDHGLYNPHTASGTLLVDGVVVSCYTGAIPVRMAHALLTPVRATVLTWFTFAKSNHRERSRRERDGGRGRK